jgi:hypothetical protein
MPFPVVCGCREAEEQDIWPDWRRHTNTRPSTPHQPLRVVRQQLPTSPEANRADVEPSPEPRRAVMRASGPGNALSIKRPYTRNGGYLSAEFIREFHIGSGGTRAGATSATIGRRLPSTRAGSLTRNISINGQYQSQPSPSPEMCPRQGRLLPGPPTRQMHLVPALERKGQIQSLR